LNTATEVLDALVESGALEEGAGRLHLGEDWSDRFERAGGDVHHNFDAGGQGIPVVDAGTGEVISYVQDSASGVNAVALAGQRWEVVSQAGEILLKPAAESRGDETFRYASKAAPTGKAFAEHVRRGLGLEEIESPILEVPGGPLWFHFGGSAYEAVLKALLPSMESVRSLKGLALRGRPEGSQLEVLGTDTDRLRGILTRFGDTLIPSMSLGRYHSDLPEAVRTQVALEMFDVDSFADWIARRRITDSGADGVTQRRVQEGLGLEP
jgi:hypothetical protein